MINFFGEYQYKDLEIVEKLITEKFEKYVGYLGWTDEENSNFELDKIIEYAKEIREKYRFVLVCGAGGSYLGARAIIEAIQGEYNNLDYKPKIVFLGNNLSSRTLGEVLEIVKNDDACLIAISKSGQTLETCIGYQLVRDSFKERYTNLSERIFIITNDEKGYLHEESKINGYRKLIVPKDVGGRYSLHTAVGLLPMAAAGVDIKSFLKGIRDYKIRMEQNFEKNPSVQYALTRKDFFRKGKSKELLVAYDEHLEYFQKWYVQLFGESEGKSKKVIFPSYAINTTDLHSMGQYIQEGPGDIFETVIAVREYKNDLKINLEEIDLQYRGLENYSLNKINNVVREATRFAHLKNDVHTVQIELERLDEYNLGELSYFFMYACFISALLFEVNPFDQPGVEQYKQIYKSLLK